MSAIAEQPKHHFIFNVKRRDRGAYVSDPRLSVQTPDGLDELPKEIKTVTPLMQKENEHEDIVTWMAAAEQHSELKWYKEQLEQRGLEIEHLNEEKNRMTVAQPISET